MKIKISKHNLPVVEKIVDSYHSGTRSILYTSGVGTGKSYIFMGIVERMLQELKSILYVIPKYAVQENISEYTDFQWLSSKIPVDFVTFNFFTDKEKGIKKLSGYDLVVIDEAHHLWSDQYGKNLAECMHLLSRTRFLGLTATPERDINEYGHRKSVHTGSIFDQTVNGISNFDAIRLGLMPKFNYRVMLPEKDPKQIREEYEGNVDVRIAYEECEQTLARIVTMYPRNKWIVYFSGKAKLHEFEDRMRKIFQGYEVFILYADLRNLSQVIADVQKAEKAVVLSVDMLLEGVHLPDVTGIVLFRNVTSLVTSQQILGRVCSIGNKTEPVIADASSSGPEMLAKLYRMDSENKTRGNGEGFGHVKPIFTLGIGSDREWKGIEEFLRLYTSMGPEMDRKEKLEKAVKKYISFNGKVYEDMERWKQNDLHYRMLLACAKCFSIPPAILAEKLQMQAAS